MDHPTKRPDSASFSDVNTPERLLKGGVLPKRMPSLPPGTGFPLRRSNAPESVLTKVLDTPSTVQESIGLMHPGSTFRGMYYDSSARNYSRNLPAPRYQPRHPLALGPCRSSPAADQNRPPHGPQQRR